MAKRYNSGKLRYDLISFEALQELAKVYTNGAHKYTTYEDKSGNQHRGANISLDDTLDMKVVSTGDNNWRLGQSWTKMMASVKRHISAWEEGEDFDPDPCMGTLHLANAAWGLFSLITYYNIHPELDDRNHQYLRLPKRIGLDIDEVICDFVGGWCGKYNIDKRPKYWRFDSKMGKRFQKMKEDNELDDFYLSLKPKINPDDIPFEPTCYITSRPVSSEITKEWLEKHKFPIAPVISVDMNQSKLEKACDMKLDLFVDDHFDNFVELNKAGICCFLMDATHNQRYDVGHKRLFSLSDLIKKL